MKVAMVIWLLAWGFVALPWRSFNPEPSFARLRLIPFQDGSARSQILNLVAFVPWGALGVSLGSSPAAVILSGAAISGVTEVGQLFSTRRYPSATDLVLNTAGTALGAAGSWFTRRRRRGSAWRVPPHGDRR